MSAATPQRDPAADLDAISAEVSSPDVPAQASTDLGGEPSGAPPRAKNIREENALRKIQSDYDQLKRLVGNKLHGRWLQELGGDGIDKALHQFETLLADPKVAEAARRLAQKPDGTWMLTPSQAAAAKVDEGLNGNGDEFVEPWEKSINDRLGPLEKRINEIIDRVSTVSQTNAQEQVARHTRQFLSEYPLSEEERGDFSDKISQRIANLDPQVVTKMSYEQFADFIGLPAARPYLGNVFARKATQKRSQIAEFATDASGVASLGAETRPNAPVRPKSISQLNRELAAAAQRAAQEAGAP